MLDLRAPLIPLSASLGVVIAAIAWLLLAGHSRALTDLSQIEQGLSALHPTSAKTLLASDDVASRILSTPLFALTTGPGAVSDMPLRLDGVAITAARKAALISINDKPATWMTVGATQDGVTLMDVQSSKVTLDTATGFKDVELGNTAAQAGSSAASTPPVNGPAAQSFRLPPATPAGAH